MKDVMLDLETLGLTPGSVVLSIGAVQFDRETGKLGDRFLSTLDIDKQTLKGLTVDPGTLQWWQDKPEAWRRATEGAADPDEVLKEFRLWYKFAGCTAVWANGANFDPPMLEAVYRAFDQKVPWNYRHPRDCRTLFDLVDKKIGDYGTENPLAHDALEDAMWQARECVKAFADIQYWKNMT